MNTISKKTGLFFGLVLAFYYVVVNVIAFFYDATLFTKSVFGIFNMLVVLILGILCIWITRKKMGNELTFKNGFSAYLVMICIGFLTNQLTIYLLFNFVSPEFKEINNQLMLDLAQANLTAMDLTQQEIDEKMAAARSIDNFALKNLLFSLAGSILRGSLAGLLIALIFKNKSEFVAPKP